MPALKDMLNPADQKWAEERAKAAKSPTHKGDIPPELYQLALHAVYFGFEAVEAVMRGHIIDVDENGKISHIPYTFETMVGLNQAARKVRYRQIIDEGDIQATSMAGITSDKGFADAIRRKSNEIRKEV